MAFPSSGAIGASDIRSQLAANNTAGAQTNVSLNDTPVRAAANVPSGSIAYSQLRGVRVLYSGLITFSYKSIQVGPGSYIRAAGYSPYFPAQYGPIGSVNTTSYYCTNGGYALTQLVYQFSNLSNTYTDLTFASGAPIPSGIPPGSINVNFNTTRYTAVPTGTLDDGTYIVGWRFSGDPFALQTKGTNGETYYVVITY